MRDSLRLMGIAFLLSAAAIAQEKSSNTALQVWTVPIGSFTAATPGVATKAVFTPDKPIVIRRIEAFSERGPVGSAGLGGQPKACSLQFALQISNGTSTQVVPISSEFVKPNSAETYTDSGRLNVRFAAGTRITLSLVSPKAGFPPAQCTCNGLNVAVQYETANGQTAESSSGSD